MKLNFNIVDKLVDKEIAKTLLSLYKKKSLIMLPAKMLDLIDVLISRDELVVLWTNKDPWGEDDIHHHYYKIWRGTVDNIPEYLKHSNVKRIFRAPKEIFEADAINILIEIK